MKIERIDIAEPGITITFTGDPFSCERKEILENLCAIVAAGYPDAQRKDSGSSEHETVFALPKGVRLRIVAGPSVSNPDCAEYLAVYDERTIDGVRSAWCLKSVYPTASGTIMTLNRNQYEQILKSVWRRSKDLKVVWVAVPEKHSDPGRHRMRHGGTNRIMDQQPGRGTAYA